MGSIHSVIVVAEQITVLGLVPVLALLVWVGILYIVGYQMGSEGIDCKGLLRGVLYPDLLYVLYLRSGQVYQTPLVSVLYLMWAMS